MVLTDEERSEIGWAHSASDRLFGEIEAAVIRKLAAGVSVEPMPAMKWQHNMYTDDQLTTAIAAARVQALEEAAKVCETEICDCCWDDDAKAAAEHLADAISALLGKEQS